MFACCAQEEVASFNTLSSRALQVGEVLLGYFRAPPQPAAATAATPAAARAACALQGGNDSGGELPTIPSCGAGGGEGGGSLEAGSVPMMVLNPCNKDVATISRSTVEALITIGYS